MGSLGENTVVEAVTVEHDAFGDGLGLWRPAPAGGCGCGVASRAALAPVGIENRFGDL